jgi:hypothetical protein
VKERVKAVAARFPIFIDLVGANGSMAPRCHLVGIKQLYSCDNNHPEGVELNPKVVAEARLGSGGAQVALVCADILDFVSRLTPGTVNIMANGIGFDSSLTPEEAVYLGALAREIINANPLGGVFCGQNSGLLRNVTMLNPGVYAPWKTAGGDVTPILVKTTPLGFTLNDLFTPLRTPDNWEKRIRLVTPKSAESVGLHVWGGMLELVHGTDKSHGVTEVPHAEIFCPDGMLNDIASRQLSLADALEMPAVTVRGDRKLAMELSECFSLPGSRRPRLQASK